MFQYTRIYIHYSIKISKYFTTQPKSIEFQFCLYPLTPVVGNIARKISPNTLCQPTASVKINIYRDLCGKRCAIGTSNGNVEYS